MLRTSSKLEFETLSEFGIFVITSHEKYSTKGTNQLLHENYQGLSEEIYNFKYIRDLTKKCLSNFWHDTILSDNPYIRDIEFNYYKQKVRDKLCIFPVHLISYFLIDVSEKLTYSLLQMYGKEKLIENLKKQGLLENGTEELFYTCLGKNIEYLYQKTQAKNQRKQQKFDQFKDKTYGMLEDRKTGAYYSQKLIDIDYMHDDNLTEEQLIDKYIGLIKEKYGDDFITVQELSNKELLKKWQDKLNEPKDNIIKFPKGGHR